MINSPKRRTALLASGAGLALTTLALNAAPATAATFAANSEGAVTFIDIYGSPATCEVHNRTVHNTDDPNQPYTFVDSGWGGDSSSCFDFVFFYLEVSYTDRSGVRRTTISTNQAPGTLKVEGTFSSITTTVRAEYTDCDSIRSATCTARAVSNPK